MSKLIDQHDLTEEQKKQIHQTGSGLKSRLDKYYLRWASGMPFSSLLSQQAKFAKKIGLNLEILIDILTQEKYLSVLETPNGLRLVFSGTCPLSDDEMMDSLQTYMLHKESENEMKKASNYGR